MLFKRRKIDNDILRVFEFSSNFFGLADQQGRAIFINKAGRKMLGLKVGADLSKFIMSDFIYSEDHKKFEKEFIQLAHLEGQTQNSIRLVNHETKLPILVEMSFSAIKNEKSGEIENYFAFAQDDLFERKRLKSDLLWQLEITKVTAKILEISQKGLPLYDVLKETLAVILNNEILKIKNQGGMFLAKGEVLHLFVQQNLATPLLSICKEVPWGRCICGRAAQRKEIVFAGCVDEQHENTFKGIGPHGHYSIPFLDENKEVLGVMVLYLEHGHQKRQEEIDYLGSIAKIISNLITKHTLDQKLEEERLKLVQSSRLATLGVMAAGVAHEINNPLSVILLSANSLAKYKDDPAIIEATVPKLLRGVERIEKIVKGLKKFSRQSDELIKKVYTVDQIIKDSIEVLESKIKISKVEVKKYKETNIEIFCDEIQIGQVLINLIGNSIDAVKDSDHPWIEIDVKNNKTDFIEIIVKDSGKGIPSETLDKLFVPFFTTKETGKGTGLGLGISKGIAEDHGGSLRYQLIDGNTAFILSLPKAEGAHEA